MGLRLLLIVTTVLSLGLAGCGKSKNTTTNNKNIVVEEEAFDPFCSNFGDSEFCESFRETSYDYGFEDYFGDDDSFADFAFNGGGGFCGCRNGYRPIIYRGLRMCEKIFRDGFEFQGIHVRYRYRNGNEDLRIAFVFDNTLSGDDLFEAQICYRTAGIRCSSHRDCNIKNKFGNSVRSVCQPLQDRNYGYCRQRDARRL